MFLIMGHDRSMPPCTEEMLQCRNSPREALPNHWESGCELRSPASPAWIFFLGTRVQQRGAIPPAWVLIQCRCLLGGVVFHDGLVAGLSGMEQARITEESSKENGGMFDHGVFLGSMVEMMLTGPHFPK
jgi:hypothetical protein